MAKKKTKPGRKKRDRKSAKTDSGTARQEPAGKRPEKPESKRKISIDLDVHKLIEATRSVFGETQNDILRRLLGLDHGAPLFEPKPAVMPPTGLQRRAKGGGAGEGGWSKVNRHGHTTFLPNGTELRAAYAGQTVNGEIRNGMWVIGDCGYNSPSAALVANVTSKTGGKVNLNGWRHWEVRPPGAETWTPLSEI
ncbi:MAG TPA: hypothetical protein VLA28_10095 [Afifellaceae bacterium]|nr:hypothetical protein [Afifellaceae bacterium]